MATSGNDNPSCGSDSSPCRTVQYAVNLALIEDVITVAAGTYTYNSEADACTFLTTRAVACFVDKHLTILGGYTTSDWSQPNPAQNITVIDGQNTRRGVAVVAYNTTASLHMEGFTIQNGLSQGTSSGDDFYTYAFGGGMWAQNSSVTLKNLIFKNNRSIGGNTGQSYGGGGSGGGLAIQSTKLGIASTLENVSFEGNQAIGGYGTDRGGVAHGGGLFTYDCTLTGNNLTFSNNRALAGNSSGAGYSNGLRADALGGGAEFQANSQITISNMTATGNYCQGGDAGSFSGAVGGGGFGGAFDAENATISISKALLKGNSATGGNSASGGFAMGGGFITNSSYATLSSLQVIGNASVSGASTTGGDAGSPSGGGGYVTNFNPVQPPLVRIENSIFTDNRVEVGSPGRYIGGGGGGLLVQALRVDIVHSTFARNYFGKYQTIGQAILVLALNGTSGTPAVVNISYTIISDHVNSSSNSSALTVFQGNTANLYRGMFAGNTNNTNSNGNPVAPGTITGLSTMLGASSIKYISPGPPNYDYHLQSSSPAIDQATGQFMGGSTSEDIDGQPRPFGSAPDIGADEYVPPGLTATPDSLTALTDGNQEISRNVIINVSSGSAVSWTATTTASWIHLGPSGTAKTATGQTGKTLVVRFAPANVDFGEYSETITVTSPSAEDTTINAPLLKVNRLYSVHLPFIIR